MSYSNTPPCSIIHQNIFLKWVYRGMTFLIFLQKCWKNVKNCFNWLNFQQSISISCGRKYSLSHLFSGCGPILSVMVEELCEDGECPSSSSTHLWTLPLQYEVWLNVILLFSCWLFNTKWIFSTVWQWGEVKDLHQHHFSTQHSRDLI